eukprot:TRINITY_DN5559_c0_g2_i1.p1 TRINITY_DN5559_c0_g2~~TRINITY_DN5559_c0_g2_i1.p1  ORF type:complete len:711 (+),score=94.66 TRINITY_DN5559_c0_g2_i1:295-2133(+)
MGLNRAMKIEDIDTVFVQEDGATIILIFKMRPGAHEPSLVLETYRHKDNNAGGNHDDPIEILRVINWLKQLYSREPLRCQRISRSADFRRDPKCGSFHKDKAYMSPKQKLDVWKNQPPMKMLPPLEPVVVPEEEVMMDPILPIMPEEVMESKEEEILMEDDMEDDAEQFLGDDEVDMADYEYEDPEPTPVPIPQPVPRPPSRHRATPPPLDDAVIKRSNEPPHVHLHLFMQRGNAAPTQKPSQPQVDLEIDDNLPSVTGIAFPPAPAEPIHEPRQPGTKVSKVPSTPVTPNPRSEPVIPNTPRTSKFEKFSEKQSLPQPSQPQPKPSVQMQPSVPEVSKQHSVQHSIIKPANPVGEAEAFKEGFIQGFVAASATPVEKQQTPVKVSTPVAQPREPQPREQSIESSLTPRRKEVYLQPYTPMMSVGAGSVMNVNKSADHQWEEGPLPRQVAQDRALKAQLRQSEMANDELRVRLDDMERRLGSLSEDRRVHNTNTTPPRMSPSHAHQRPDRARAREKPVSDRETAFMRSIQNGLQVDRIQNETPNWIDNPVSPVVHATRGGGVTQGSVRRHYVAPGTATKRSPRRQRPDHQTAGSRGKYWSSFVNEWDTQNNY